MASIETMAENQQILEQEYRKYIKNALSRGAVFQIIAGIFYFVLDRKRVV